jgi:hypothetical protein
MQSLFKRLVSIPQIVLCFVAACGDGSEQGMATTADSGPLPLIEVVRQEIANYDRRVRASCVCGVKMGTYPTEQACLEIGLSGPDWVECETAALKDYDSPQTRADSQCYQDFFKNSAECTEKSGCDPDKLNACGSFTAECLQLNNQRLNLILAACPDFGLLSRLN